MKNIFSIFLVLLLLSLTACTGATAGKRLGSAIAVPDYPQMAGYPDEGAYIDKKTGAFDDEGFSKAYDAWKADKKRQAAYRERFKGDFLPYFERSSREILQDPKQVNQVYSPLSLYMALSMLAELSGGTSRQEVLNVLGQTDLQEVRTNAEALWQMNYSADGATSSCLANSLWLDQKLTYQNDTVQRISQDYRASVFRGTMGSKEFNDDLHAWINRETGNLLEEQAGKVNFDDQTVMGLASTVYFQAKWRDEFMRSETKQQVFHGRERDVDCDFMRTSGNDLYYWGEHFSAVHKPLEGGNMWFILPDEKAEVEEILADPQFYRLTAQAFPDETWTNVKALKVNLSLPKFDVAADYDLISHLRSLGLDSILDLRRADFSPLLPDRDIAAYLAEARQGTRVAVDEEGVTAASFTVMATCGAAMPLEEEIDFVLDRPFLFVINGLADFPLFIGVVNQPN